SISPTCQNCECCSEYCGFADLNFGEVDLFVQSWAQCPINLALTTEPEVSGGPESEEGGRLYGPSYLMDLWGIVGSSPDWDDGDLGDVWDDPGGCSNPTIPIPGGSTPGCNFMCIDCELGHFDDPSIPPLHGRNSAAARGEVSAGASD